MTFEEWWEAGYSNQVDMDCARQAWDYQQQRIDELELVSSKMETPTGYMLVPIEPTKDMIDAALKAPIPAVHLDSIRGIGALTLKTQYKAMIQAAQEQE